MADDATPTAVSPQQEVSPQQQQQNRYIDLVVNKLKDRLGDRDIEIAQLQARIELIAGERDYFLKALRDNGLVQEEPQVERMPPPAPAEVVPEDEVEVLSPA